MENYINNLDLVLGDVDITLDENAIEPERQYAFDGGADLFSPVDCTIEPMSDIVIDTGVHFCIPKSFCGIVMNRSGMNMKYKVETALGLIDSGYTGSVRVRLVNESNEEYNIKRGDRISQIIIIPCNVSGFHLVDNLDKTERGKDGFGSTGK